MRNRGIPCPDCSDAAHRRIREACAVVEQYARGVGRKVEIVFLDIGVQVAPLEDSGCTIETTLYEALTAARRT